MTTTHNQIDGQLELSFATANGPRRTARREHRMARASWWFNKMRAVVNNSMDWPPQSSARPEQALFPGAYRQVRI